MSAWVRAAMEAPRRLLVRQVFKGLCAAMHT